MNALVTAAKKEGHLNVIMLPSDWANYGAIMKDFQAKYGITITDENPDGTSQDELNAIAQTKGQSRAPDVQGPAQPHPAAVTPEFARFRPVLDRLLR
ncbi:MAG: hypothetical protein ACRDN0_34890 [Trebonia sp.]